MSPTKRPSLTFSLVDGVTLIAHGADPPDDATWDRLVSTVLESCRTTRFGRTLATSAGGAPTAAQRHRMDLRFRAFLREYPDIRGRMAVMSGSFFVRAVVQASTLLEQNWLLRKAGGAESSQVYRAFAPTELSQALAWLGARAGTEENIARELNKLRQAVG